MITELFDRTAPSLGLRVEVQPTSARAPYRNSPVFANRSAVVEAIVSLGYPLARYINASSANVSVRLDKIFSRARLSYYQNHREFASLKKLLESEVSGLSDATLSTLSGYATPFVPMWMGAKKAAAALAVLG